MKKDLDVSLPTRPTQLPFLCIDPFIPDIVKKDLHRSDGRELLILSVISAEIRESHIRSLAFGCILKKDKSR
jgi:hypothetical protein